MLLDRWMLYNHPHTTITFPGGLSKAIKGVAMIGLEYFDQPDEDQVVESSLYALVRFPWFSLQK
jgi:hypothetical protein